MPYGGKGPTVVGLLWSETILSLVFVSLRLYTRARIMCGLRWDDHFAIISWAMLMFNTVFCTIAAVNGFGVRSQFLTLPEIAQANKWTIVAQTFHIIGIATSKSAVALFLTAIVAHKSQRIFIYFMIGSLLLLFGFCAIVDFARCTPVAHVWNPSIPANCWLSAEAFTIYSIALAVYSAIIDIVLIVFPWYILWNLQMKRKEKVLIGSAMSLGIFAFACAVIKTIALRGLNARSDYTYETVPLVIWGSSEIATGIVTCCIPTLRPLYKKVFGLSSSLPTPNYYEFENHRSQTLPPENQGDNELADMHCGDNGDKPKTVIKHERRDDSSERSILGSTRGIKQTQEITVTVETI